MAGSAEFDALIERYHDALGSIIKGNPDNYKSFYSDGDDPEFNAQVYLWRIGNLVLAARRSVGVGA